MDTNKATPKQNDNDANRDAATDLIRGKLGRLYGSEPSATQEIGEVVELKSDQVKLSKHQAYMDSLTTSGRGLEEIQTAWHDYYQNLPDSQKHEVWNEFYAKHEQLRRKKSESEIKPNQPIVAPERSPNEKPEKSRTTRVKEDLLNKVSERAKKSSNKSHGHSLLFGLGMGSLTVFILLFSFFNERFITPFITPSKNVSATSIIVDATQTENVDATPKIIIPKINVEAPVVYDLKTIEEKEVQKGLQRGVVHYPITPNPGEKGNAVIFGHSSGNILNNGDYKFAFLLLKSLENEDTFIIHKDKKRYVYKVFNKFITSPNDLSVLQKTEKTASVTLITCDPPGSSANRLIIQGEQIFPKPDKNTESTATPDTAASAPVELPSNSPSLWYRLTHWF